MRTLTVQEMEQATGGVLPILGVVIAFGGLVVRHKVASAIIGLAGLALAGQQLADSDNNSCSAE